MIPLIALFALGIFATLYVVIGMTRNDIAEIRARRMVKKHPHARRLRERPTVYVIINGTATDECLKSIRRNRYKKLVVSQAEAVPQGALMLTIDGTTTLEPESVLQAIQQLTVQERSKPTITPILPADIRDLFSLFHVYQTLSSLPFAAARSGFARTSQRTFDLLMPLFKLVNLSVFVYACYAAAELRQPELILLYVCTLGFWMTWSLLRYPYLRPAKKIGLFILMPVSFVYFIYRTIAAPFAPRSLQAYPQNGIIRT